MVTRGKNPVDRAYRYLRLSPKDRVVFMDNLVAAFSLLESTGGVSNIYVGLQMFRSQARRVKL
jgi:hypothetical protein